MPRLRPPASGVLAVRRRWCGIAQPSALRRFFVFVLFLFLFFRFCLRFRFRCLLFEPRIDSVLWCRSGPKLTTCGPRRTAIPVFLAPAAPRAYRHLQIQYCLYSCRLAAAAAAAAALLPPSPTRIDSPGWLSTQRTCVPTHAQGPVASACAPVCYEVHMAALPQSPGPCTAYVQP
jgi:hypothetical protein